MINNLNYSKSIIFDLDGTLVDSAPGIVSCLSRVINPLCQDSCPVS